MKDSEIYEGIMADDIYIFTESGEKIAEITHVNFDELSNTELSFEVTGFTAELFDVVYKSNKKSDFDSFIENNITKSKIKEYSLDKKDFRIYKIITDAILYSSITNKIIAHEYNILNKVKFISMDKIRKEVGKATTYKLNFKLEADEDGKTGKKIVKEV